MKINIPEGTRDYTAEECAKRNKISNILLNLFNLWGYNEISTPTIEFFNTFNYKEQSLREEEMYKFFDNRGRILVLRPDMTIPVARMVSTKLKDMEVPIKLCYSANIYRVNESLLGRQNEFKDCGIELIGVEDKKSDLEILVTAIEAIRALNFKNIKLEIGNVNILKGAMKNMFINDEDKEIIAELINKKSLISLEDYVNSLKIKVEEKNFLLKLPLLFGEADSLSKVKEFNLDVEVKNSIKYLEWLYKSLCKLGYEEYISIDMAMVPRLNYYTGVIFRGYVNGIGKEILTGGRYDNLIQNFGRDLNAIGFSLKLDLIVDNYTDIEHDNIEKDIVIENNNEIEAIGQALKYTKEKKRVKMVYKGVNK